MKRDSTFVLWHERIVYLVGGNMWVLRDIFETVYFNSAFSRGQYLMVCAKGFDFPGMLYILSYVWMHFWAGSVTVSLQVCSVCHAGSHCRGSTLLSRFHSRGRASQWLAVLNPFVRRAPVHIHRLSYGSSRLLVESNDSEFQRLQKST